VPVEASLRAVRRPGSARTDRATPRRSVRLGPHR
jgi:hypothetical protein